MHVQRRADSPVNRRGGQESHLLLTRGRFGSRNLTITWVTGAPGSEQPSHQHSANEQVYVIIQGSGLMKVGDETREVSAGDLIFVPPGSPHSIRNNGDEPLAFVSAAAPPIDVDALEPEFHYQAR